ncbi:MAG: HAD family phosphatase [Hyphomonadaceae bacterium]|nr:HAD family phosphatase [Hyphomonadaceae bacterium]
MSLPRRPQAVIFDFDGLVIDSERLVRDAMIAVAPKFGREVDEAFFLSLVGRARDHNTAALHAFFGPGFAIEDFHTAVGAHIGGASFGGAPLKTGVTELLDVLDAAATPRAIATSSSHDWVQRHLTLHALDARFNTVVASGDYANSKPHPEPYLTAAARLGVAPELCLALEDSYSGVTAAHAAGMMTIMAPDLLAPTEDMRARTVRIVETLHEVAALLR